MIELTSQNKFRLLILLPPFLAAIGTVLVQPQLSPEAQALLENAKDKPVETYWTVVALLSIIITIIQVVAIVGVIRFKLWARPAYVAISLVANAYAFLMTDQITTGFATGINSIGSFVAGMVTVLMYTQPIRSYFKEKNITNAAI